MKSHNLTAQEDEALKELRNDLAALLGDRLVQMVLFGSRVRGDYEEESDIDIAIIVESVSREVKNKIFEKVSEIELKYLTPMSTIVFSTAEFNRLRDRERRIVLDIEKEGVSI